MVVLFIFLLVLFFVMSVWLGYELVYIVRDYMKNDFLHEKYALAVTVCFMLFSGGFSIFLYLLLTRLV